jgi:predicted enzyme related to lactoylglutathione lyase
MARVIHFEVPVDDPERAQAFYREAFGWEIGSWGGPADYWLATTGPEGEPGINGALTRRSATSAWLHVGVASVDEAIGRIESVGGAALTPKVPIPGVGYMAYCRDTEGNAIGVYEDDPTAG